MAHGLHCMKGNCFKEWSVWQDIYKTSLANFLSIPKGHSPFPEPGNSAESSSTWAKVHSLSGQFECARLGQKMVGIEGNVPRSYQKRPLSVSSLIESWQ